MTVFLSRPDREPPTNEAEAATLLRSMTACTGHFRVEGDKFITSVDGAWNEIVKSHEQLRVFKLEGDELTICIHEQASDLGPGRSQLKAKRLQQRAMVRQLKRYVALVQRRGHR